MGRAEAPPPTCVTCCSSARTRGSTATTVRMRNGKAVMTDEPFAETKEQMGGYHIVEAENLDEAISIAARHPAVRAGRHAIEVRPVREGHALHVADLQG